MCVDSFDQYVSAGCFDRYADRLTSRPKLHSKVSSRYLTAQLGVMAFLEDNEWHTFRGRSTEPDGRTRRRDVARGRCASIGWIVTGAFGGSSDCASYASGSAHWLLFVSCEPGLITCTIGVINSQCAVATEGELALGCGLFD